MPTSQSGWELAAFGFELGIVIAAAFFICIKIGLYFDQHFTTPPAGVVGGVVIAFVLLGFWIRYRVQPYLN